jgi:integrase/recombinase XerD
MYQHTAVSEIKQNVGFRLASVALREALTQFMLSRQSIRCSATTMAFYSFTAGVFVNWLENQGLTMPDDVSAQHVREYLSELVQRGMKDTTCHAHARAIKSLVHFWASEGYLAAPILFQMPKLSKKRLPMLSADEVAKILGLCKQPRNKALLLLLADSGLRRAEVCDLNCGDVDLAAGRVLVREGKGGKARTAVVGPTTRRALLSYRPELQDPVCAEEPLFLARGGERLTGAGLMLMLRRLSARTGIHITAHALRRTFVILSLRAGMDSLHLQAMLGHSSLAMTRHYASMVDDDLLQAHRLHSPIENLARLRQKAGEQRAFARPRHPGPAHTRGRKVVA